MALSTRTPTKPVYAREGVCYIASSAFVTVGATSLSGSFAASTASYNIVSAVKNITVTPPETPHDKIDFLGVDTNSFQNQMLEQKPVGTAALTATLIVDKDEIIEDLVVSGATAGATGYTRYQIGKTYDNLLAVAVSFSNTPFTKQVTYLLKDAVCTKLGDIKISSDGHLEQDVAYMCLAKNFYYEFKD